MFNRYLLAMQFKIFWNNKFQLFSASTLLNPEDSCRIEHDDCKLSYNNTYPIILHYSYFSEMCNCAANNFQT